MRCMRKVALAAAVVLTATPAIAETYRLVHAVGNAEKINAKGLSKSECESRKGELKRVALLTGVGGSITCLPDSLFSD